MSQYTSKVIKADLPISLSFYTVGQVVCLIDQESYHEEAQIIFVQPVLHKVATRLLCSAETTITTSIGNSYLDRFIHYYQANIP